VTNPATATGATGTAFSQTFTAAGGISPYTFTTTSALPAGLTLATTGTLSGTPAATGSFPITVTAKDANNCTGNGSVYTLVISCGTITVTKPATATGTTGTAFSQTFTASGGISPYTFTTTSALPAGLGLASNGTLSGTPTVTGTFPITVTAKDTNNCTGTSAVYTLVISCGAIAVTNPTVTTWTVNAPFSQIFTATGGTSPYTFTTTSALPAGLTLATNGTLSGTPTATGTFPITVTAKDANNCTGTGSVYTLIISTCCDQDVTCDGSVNIIDMVKIQRVILGLDPAASCPRCDVNHDGLVNIVDMIKVQRVILGLDTCG
jgi:large repetitive protein